MKQTIEVEGVPEGYRVISHATVSGINSGLTSYPVPPKVEKIQPRRKLSAQEIAEDYDPSAPNGYD